MTGPLTGLFKRLPISVPQSFNKPIHPFISHVTATVSGHWTPSETVTPDDTLPVFVVIHDDSAIVTIGTDTVIVDSLRIIAEVEPLRWRVFAEAAPGIGVGVAWEPIRAFGLQAGPYISGDVRRAEWASLGLRVSRRIHSTPDIGAEVGYRIGEDAGLHLGVSVGFSL